MLLMFCCVGDVAVFVVVAVAVAAALALPLAAAKIRSTMLLFKERSSTKPKNERYC